ncbi:MAG: protein translocase subunit SecD, partial [Micrococcales bacterium]|nr:protein translocase subunit SecD [Micrococcales bacterium]
AATASPAAGATPAATDATPTAATPTATSTTPAPTPSPTGPATSGEGPSSPSDTAYYITPAIQSQYNALDCSKQSNLTGGVNGAADEAFVTCSQDGTSKFILGPVELQGARIKSATSGLNILPNGSTGTTWVVNLTLDGQGTTQFAATTTRLYSQASPLNQFAVVLDGLVVSAPAVDEAIPNGRAVISGSFTRASAATLANQLSFGALPVSFQVESQQQVSATLGAEQLQRGMIAGLIGLLLVFAYSLFQYRALGFLTIGSLVVAGAMTYGSLVLLSWGMGYRLSLAGVAGVIVAIGFTADSFIVYFERIRDELRDGRSLAGAVERGWVRARRTILAAKGVNLVSAIVLYYLAVGNVQGFAFTLGLTTIIDVIVVFWFTHPMMEVISRVPFFRDGHRWSGLSPDRLQASGVRYVGAGRFEMPREATAVEPVAEVEVATSAPVSTATPVRTAPVSTATPARTAPARTATPQASGDGMTIAERRAAARAKGAAPGKGKSGSGDGNEEIR